MDGLDVYVAGKADVNFLFDRYISTKTELRSTTQSNYMYTWDHFVRETFGKKKIKDAPIKSVGNGITAPRDLESDEDVKIVLYILAESVAARLRENGFRCRVVEISVRDKDLCSFTCQRKIKNATNITKEIAEQAFQLFKENYNWNKTVRSLGVRGADLVTDNYWEQIDLFSSVEKREKQMRMDEAVDEIRKRFGFYSVQRGLMYQDRKLSAVNAKAEHTIHPRGYFA